MSWHILLMGQWNIQKHQVDISNLKSHEKQKLKMKLSENNIE